MFGIRIDNEWADVRNMEPIKLSRWNSLFDFETVRGSLVNDFDLPFTSKNDKIFGWYRESGMRFPNRKYYCEKVVDGYVIERGFVELVDVTEEGYVVIFSQNLSEFFGEYQNVSLNKLPLGSEAVAVPVMAANHLTDKYCYPTVENPDFYGNNVQAGWNGKMNEWSGGVLNAHARVPMLFMRWFFEKMADLCGFTFGGDFFDTELYKRGVIFNTYSLDDVSEIHYANHLPEMTMVEFLLQLRRLLNLALYFDVNNRIMYAYMGNELMDRPTVLNWTTKVVPSRSRTPERNNRLRLDWELDQADNIMKRVPLPTGFDFYVTPETQYGFERFIGTKISTITVDGGVAKVEQIGVTPRFNQGGQKFGARLALWGGVVGGVPVVTNNHSGWNLAWSGANNLKDKCWSNYERLIANTSYKVVLAYLNAMDLSNIDWHNNVNAHHSVYIRNKEYYVSQVECQLPLEGLSQLYLVER